MSFILDEKNQLPKGLNKGDYKSKGFGAFLKTTLDNNAISSRQLGRFIKVTIAGGCLSLRGVGRSTEDTISLCFALRPGRPTLLS